LQVGKKLRNQLLKTVSSRSSALCLEFQFWHFTAPPPAEQNDPRVFELRSYTLKVFFFLNHMSSEEIKSITIMAACEFQELILQIFFNRFSISPVTCLSGATTGKRSSFSWLFPGFFVSFAKKAVDPFIRQKGLEYRRQVCTPVGAFFSQLGPLNTVHHLWCYKSLADRRQKREAAWSVEGWADTVRKTVPLVDKMETRILYPTSFSNLK
jgi:hypothetical protein